MLSNRQILHVGEEKRLIENVVHQSVVFAQLTGLQACIRHVKGRARHAAAVLLLAEKADRVIIIVKLLVFYQREPPVHRQNRHFAEEARPQADFDLFHEIAHVVRVGRTAELRDDHRLLFRLREIAAAAQQIDELCCSAAAVVGVRRQQIQFGHGGNRRVDTMVAEHPMRRDGMLIDVDAFQIAAHFMMPRRDVSCPLVVGDVRPCQIDFREQLPEEDVRAGGPSGDHVVRQILEHLLRLRVGEILFAAFQKAAKILVERIPLPFRVVGHAELAMVVDDENQLDAVFLRQTENVVKHPCAVLVELADAMEAGRVVDPFQREPP